MWPWTAFALPRKVQLKMVVTRRTRSYSWQPRFCGQRSRRAWCWCPPPQNRAVNAIMWKYTVVEPGRPQTTIWYIPNITNTHSEYVVLIAFLLQQRLHERTLMLCYTYMACLVIYGFTELVLYSVAHTPTFRTCCLSTSVNVSTAFSHFKHKTAQVRKFHYPKIFYK